MYRFLFLAFAVVVAGTAWGQAKPDFRIKGKISGFGENITDVLMNYRVDGKSVTDTAVLKNGKFKFEGKLSGPVLASLRLRYAPDEEGKMVRLTAKDYGSVFLQPGKIAVSSIDSFSNMKVKGSKAHDDYTEVRKLADRSEQMRELSKLYSEKNAAKDEEGKEEVMNSIRAVQKEVKEAQKQYLIDNPSSPVAFYVLSQVAGYDMDPEEVEPLFNSLPMALQNSAQGTAFKDRIETAKKTSVGAVAMEFTQEDTAGVPVSLSSFRGKYVLIDFWASWCGPCRVENPNVVEAFNKFNNRGFEVLGVSLDREGDREKWLKAIYDDKLTWTQLSDLKFWDNAVSRQYGIQAIPQNFLVDPNGVIIAKNLRGKALQDKLAEIFP